MAKTPQLHPKQSIPVSYPKLTFIPIFGSLGATVCSNHFYKFVALALMVLYQLESLNLDHYNLTYSQNKNRVFKKKIDSNSFETSPFHLYKKFLKTNPNQSKQPNTTESNPQNLFTTNTNTFIQNFWGFHQPNTRKEKLGFGFHTFNILILQYQASFFLLISQTLGYLEKNHQSPFSISPNSLFLSQNGNAQM